MKKCTAHERYHCCLHRRRSRLFLLMFLVTPTLRLDNRLQGAFPPRGVRFLRSPRAEGFFTSPQYSPLLRLSDNAVFVVAPIGNQLDQITTTISITGVLGYTRAHVLRMHVVRVYYAYPYIYIYIYMCVRVCAH